MEKYCTVNRVKFLAFYSIFRVLEDEGLPKPMVCILGLWVAKGSRGERSFVRKIISFQNNNKMISAKCAVDEN